MIVFKLNQLLKSSSGMWGGRTNTWKRQLLCKVFLGWGEMRVLIRQDLGFILGKDGTQPQGNNLEQESESEGGH